jgi:hypothetical protein
MLQDEKLTDPLHTLADCPNYELGQHPTIKCRAVFEGLAV